MKIKTTCMKCTFEDGRESEVSSLQITDNNLYTFKCSYGHENALYHQQQKFELLFESAVHAICDGYLREAVSSIAASLERFYEFFIKFISIKNEIDENVFDKTWNLLSKQSERQLGAFIFIYCQEFGKPPTLLQNNQIEFRNNIIHKGYFPSYEKTIEFGQKVLDFIVEILGILKCKYPEKISEIIMLHNFKLLTEAIKITDQPIVLSSSTIIGLSRDYDNSKPIILEEYVTYKKNKQN
ncbi:MAG: hypothetical protein REI96_22570 [Flavobacterium nitrogenifigens]|uniref:hypothetical protein n=1 Tax=Flavobacterium nitrogenifigens TaxID=1617283 RepID=UPI0028072499|nr:hypothetical protein [Flavobacterium nitrogenifigens]MDQ8015248.1 hypothetical protein [Flavobacterium nitrogenifigens]